MIKLAFSIAFLAVFGVVAYAIVVLLLALIVLSIGVVIDFKKIEPTPKGLKSIAEIAIETITR